MRTTEHIEKYRITNNVQNPMFNTTAECGMNGMFQIPFGEDRKIQFLVIVSDGAEVIPWEHVSARARSMSGGKWYERVPNWREMCFLKDLFWGDDEVVIQIHPKKKDYINTHPNVLHLWRFKGEMPTPPLVCV